MKLYKYALIVLTVPTLLVSQQTDTVKVPVVVTVSPIDFSGVLLANYQYRGDRGPQEAQNKFDLERAYLTFKMPAGDRASIRITADVFQQQNPNNDSYYRGWVLRAKYAYLQYNLLTGPGLASNIRGGLLPNVAIEHLETFWPRWISQTAVERAGFFSSSDAGVSSTWNLGKALELYTTIVNGPGYTSRETDRFKDYAARLSLTSFAPFTLTGWWYQGAVGSKFSAVGSSLPRVRSGVFLGLKTPVLTAGAEYDRRKDGGETGSNTFTSPRVEVDSSGRLTSFFAQFKPFSFPLGAIGRVDNFRPNEAFQAKLVTRIVGLTYDLNKKVGLSADYQEQLPKDGLVAALSKTYFLHLVANF